MFKAEPNKLKISGLQSSGMLLCCWRVGPLTLENEGITFLCCAGNYSPKMQHHIPEDGNSELHCCVNLKTCDIKISHPCLS